MESDEAHPAPPPWGTTLVPAAAEAAPAPAASTPAPASSTLAHPPPLTTAKEEVPMQAEEQPKGFFGKVRGPYNLFPVPPGEYLFKGDAEHPFRGSVYEAENIGEPRGPEQWKEREPPVGSFICETMPKPRPDALSRKFHQMWRRGEEKKSEEWEDLRVIDVADGEIMKNIQAAGPDGAWFVLPSQLNGAEYPSERSAVMRVEDYKYDNTGGPRGQLACHPAAAQFILDNAARYDNKDGINAVDFLRDKGDSEHSLEDQGFELVNGYLKMPTPGELPQYYGQQPQEPALSPEEATQEAERLRDAFLERLAGLRPLMMADVLASGLDPSKRGHHENKEGYRVGLVYASAVPLQTYLNYPRSEPARVLHRQVAQAVLLAQYYGALARIARLARDANRAKKTTVYLMPLGGGVFNNPLESIADAMSAAVELLHEEDSTLLDLLDVKVLAWEGNRREGDTFRRLLGVCKKLVEPEPPTDSSSAPAATSPLPPYPAQAAITSTGGAAAYQAAIASTGGAAAYQEPASWA